MSGPHWSGKQPLNRRSDISIEYRINEQIRAARVRLVHNEQPAIVPLAEALETAQAEGLDLVEVAAEADPPVCRIMDYGKYRYLQSHKSRQVQPPLKEIKFRPKIDPHDYGTKKGHVERFLAAGSKVRVTVMFRGREQSRPELGLRLLRQLEQDLEASGTFESQPRQDGRNMIVTIAPKGKT